MKYPFNYLFFISILFLVSCAKKENQFTDNDVFRYNESANIQTLDPAFARNMAIIWPCNQLFNGLVQLDSQLHVQACLAKSWEISEDGKTYTFYFLRFQLSD